jgi:hypothetical protein
MARERTPVISGCAAKKNGISQSWRARGSLLLKLFTMKKTTSSKTKLLPAVDESANLEEQVTERRIFRTKKNSVWIRLGTRDEQT